MIDESGWGRREAPHIKPHLSGIQWDPFGESLHKTDRTIAQCPKVEAVGIMIGGRSKAGTTVPDKRREGLEVKDVGKRDVDK